MEWIRATEALTTIWPGIACFSQGIAELLDLVPAASVLPHRISIVLF